MQTLAVGGQFPLSLCLAPPDGQIPLAVLPPEALLPTFLAAALLIIIVRVIGPPLPLHLPLHPPDRFGIGREFGTEQLQTRGAFTWHDGKRRRPQVQSNGVLADRVVGLLIRDALQEELDEVALTPGVSPQRVGTGGWALNQPRLCDGVVQAVSHHWIFPVDDGRQPIVLPQQRPGVPLLGRLEDEPQPGIGAFILETGQTPPPATRPARGGPGPDTPG